MVEDTYKFSSDKQSHLGVSFGLFYFFLTYVHDVSIAIGLSVLVGVTFELYQGVSKTYGGCSYQDMIYNLKTKKPGGMKTLPKGMSRMKYTKEGE